MNQPINIERTAEGYRHGNLLATGLPPAQSRALLLRARGMTGADVAKALSCSPGNIRNLMGILFYKTGAGNAPGLVTRAFECGFLRLLSLLLAGYLGLMGGVGLNDDARRSRRDSPRGASRLARRGHRRGLDLFWDDDTQQLLTVPEGQPHA